MSTKLEVEGVTVRSIGWEKIVRRTFWECYLMARKDAKAQRDGWMLMQSVSVYLFFLFLNANPHS